MNAVKTFFGLSHVAGNNEDVQVFERFLSSFKIFEIKFLAMLGMPLRWQKKKRLRMPQELPIDRDLEKFRNFTVNTIRDAACARMTSLREKG